MTLCLKTSGDLDGLCEVSFVRYLHDVSPAALEVLREDGGDVLDFRRAWRGWALILRRRCRHRLFSSLSDQLAVDGFALDCAVQRTEDAAAVAELSRVSVRIDRCLTFRSRELLGLFRLVFVQVVADVIVFLVRPLVGAFDQIVLDDLRDFGQRVVGFKNRKRLRQEFQRLVPDQLAVNGRKISNKVHPRYCTFSPLTTDRFPASHSAPSGCEGFFLGSGRRTDYSATRKASG